MKVKDAIYNHWHVALSVLFGLGLWFFWAVPFLPVLSYQEQYQLFLSTWDYFVERMSVPGGLMDYAGEWVTQWAHYPALGGFLIALIFVSIQVLTWLIAKRLGANRGYYAFTFLPAIAAWQYICDGDVLFSFGLSFVGTLGLMLAYEVVTCKWGRWALLVVGIPAGYWLIGPTVYVAVAYAVVREIVVKRSIGAVAAGVGMVIYVVVLVIGSSYVVRYSLDRLAMGIVYHQFPEHELAEHIGMLLTLLAVPLILWFCSARWKCLPLVGVAIVAIVGVFWVKTGIREQTVERVTYEYLVRTEQWDKILAKATETRPTLPASICAVNIALSEKGQLAERLFDFYQYGISGLIPSFALNMVGPVMPAEVFFRLGMVNECEHYMFEAQMAIPNNKLSGRLTQRIAECQIINGKYDIARKNLKLLEKSPVYRKWARARLDLIRNDNAVHEHPLYGKLRQFRQQTKDFLYSPAEIDKIFGLLFMNNFANVKAFEYLICYEMLNCDMERFMTYIPLIRHTGYKRLPRSCQEVLICNWRQTHGSLKDIPYPVDSFVAKNTMEFIRRYMANQGDPTLNEPPFSSNALHYILGGTTQQVAEGTNTVY